MLTCHVNRSFTSETFTCTVNLLPTCEVAFLILDGSTKTVVVELVAEELIKSTRTEVTTGALITRRIPKSENKSESFTLALFTETKILLVLLSLGLILLFFSVR